MTSLGPQIIQQLLSQYDFEVDHGYENKGLTCTMCDRLMIDAYQTFCGCKYCHKCIIKHLDGMDEYCRGGKSECSEEPLVLDRNVTSNAALNRQISKLRVVCPYESCGTINSLCEMEEHMELCAHKPMGCPYSEIGCDCGMTSKQKMATHFHKTIFEHSQLMLESIKELRAKFDVSLEDAVNERIKCCEDRRNESIIKNKEMNEMRSQMARDKSEVSSREDGATPLDLAKANNKNKCEKILLAAMSDETVIRRSPRIIEAMKSKPVSKQEVRDWISSRSRPDAPQSLELAQERLLYRCICHSDQSGFATLCTPEIVNRKIVPSALETAVEFECDFFVDHILKQSVSVDESWTRATTLAKRKELTNISLLLSERRAYLGEMKERGFSRLHIAVYDNDPNMVRYILHNQLCDPDEGDKTVGTALSLAYSQGHMNCVRCLQDNNVNVNTVNRLGQSPLHVAITNNRVDCCEYLVDNMDGFEVVDYMGLSVLALAVMNDCRNICERIVGSLKRFDLCVKIDSRILDVDPDLRMMLNSSPRMPITNKETMSSLCLKINRTIYPCLLNKIDKQMVDEVDGHSNTLLHLCAVSLLPDMCHQLIQMSANVSLINNRGETPLLALISGNNIDYNTDKIDDIAITERGAVGGRGVVGGSSEFDINMIKAVDVLIAAGSSVNVENSKGLNLLRIATEYNSESLLLALIKKKARITLVKKAEWLSWFHRKIFVFLAEVIPLIDKSLLSVWITVDLIECTAKVADLSLVKALYDMAVYDVKTRAAETILYMAAINGQQALFKQIVMNRISSNSSLAGGESLLHCLIRERKATFYRILLNSKNSASLCDKKDVRNRLPLHVCIESDNWDIIDKLIWDTKSVNEEDNDGHTPLSMLLVKMSESKRDATIERLMTHVRTLITRSADVYRVNKLGRTALSYCTNTRLQQQITTFFQMKDSPPSPRMVSTGICSICCDERINCALTCGHMFCMTCADKEIRCYVCRSVITDKIRLFT